MQKQCLFLILILCMSIVFWSCSDEEDNDNPPVIDEMVLVSGGTFLMGDEVGDLWDGCRPVHSVTLNDFYIGRYEVTQEKWTKYMSALDYNYGQGDNYPVYRISFFEILTYCNLRSMDENLLPCYSINNSTNPYDWGSIPDDFDENWNSVVCNWNANGYRLPTEAEWEFAARGGNNYDDYFLFSGSNNIEEVAWSYPNSGNSTHPVGTKSSNKLGLYDMSGNVWEWCWDISEVDYSLTSYDSSAVVNPTGSISGNTRILRGGSWDPESDNSICRVAMRNFTWDLYDYILDFGFRLARTPSQKE